MTTWAEALALTKVLRELPQRLFRADFEMSITSYVMSRNRLPKEVIRSRRFWYSETVDFDVREWTGFLFV